MFSYSKAAVTSSEALFSALHSSTSGLSTNQSIQNANEFGKNSSKSQKLSWVSILLRQLKSPFIYLLLAAALVSFFLGESRDALFIIVFIVINTALGFYQEYKSESAAEALSHFIESTARVFRNGKLQMLKSSEIVVGDIIELKPGDILQADMRLLETTHFSVNESILTGESESQLKSAKVLDVTPQDFFAAKNIAFSGTTVVTGHAIALVIRVGQSRVMSEIVSIAESAHRVSSFEKGVSKISNFILKTIGVTLILVIIANMLVKGSAIALPSLLLFAIALAVSVIPEALPVVTTFSLSQGALKLARKKVVVKRLSAIEDMGSISVLCTDKTGTITENKLSLTKSLSYDGADIQLYSALSCSLDANISDQDEFDAALLSRNSERIKGFKRLAYLPFDPESKKSAQLVSGQGVHLLITRGAPESILPLIPKLIDEKKLQNWIADEGYQGRRVLAVAYKTFLKRPHKSAVRDESKLKLAGFVSFEDPLKETTIEAVEKAKQLGVQLKIITGDRPEVASSVGVSIGLISKDDVVLTGFEYSTLSEEEKDLAVQTHHIFARATPEVKFDIIKRLQNWHEVGFLGEGINDAPALKIANVGIVVESAAGVSREAADIILLDKSLLAIIEGIEDGRAVFANTAKYIKATLTGNFGNFYAVAISSLLVPFLPLLPIQILLVNLLSDFPMISIATDTIDKEELTTPRTYNIREIATHALVLGGVSTFFDFLTFALFFQSGERILQTNWFVVSILTELVLIYSIRTKRLFWKSARPSFVLIALTLLAAGATVVLPFTSFGQNTFFFVMPSVSTVLQLVVLVLVYFVSTEVAKWGLLKYEAGHSKLSAA